jgi:integrator complex subunit 8
VADCKQCLSALQSGDTVIPRLEVMEHCAICLLNLGEWEYLTGLEKRWNYFEIAAAIAYACLDIAKYKGNKKVSRDAWDIGRKTTHSDLWLGTYDVTFLVLNALCF